MANNKDYKPDILKSDKTLKRQLDSGSMYVDALVNQSKELFKILNTELVDELGAKSYQSKKYNEHISRLESNYFYYPWIDTVVRCIDESNYYKLITNRNRDLITSIQQRKLYSYRIAVLGLSVGSSIAYSLTQSGISKDILLADFDELDTTNLNRIFAGVHQIGLNKAVVAARKIYEFNPYASVELLDKGINPRNLEKLLKEQKIDCIVEEIDQMEMKIDTRVLAKKYKVPVLMVTDNGDRAVLHIERYDLGYGKIFDSDVKYWIDKMKKYSGKKDFADIVVNQIVGGPEHVDPKMLACAEKVVNRQLVSWPQLGSSASLGGIAVTIAVKNIVSGRDNRLSHREYVSLMEKI